MDKNKKELSQQDLINDLLISEKQICSAYNTSITETSCPNLRQHLTKSLVGCQKIQYKIFNAMEQRGWYQTKPAASQDVQNAKNKYNQIKSDLQQQ